MKLKNARRKCQREFGRWTLIRVRRGSALVSMIGLTMLAAFFAGMLLPAMHRGSETADRVKCANNMKQIGLAIMLYTNENRGNYPRTKYEGGDTVIPDVSNGGFDTPDPFALDSKVPVNCVPASLFLLVRTEDITPAVFVCPTSGASPDVFGGGGNAVANRSNFSNLSQNLSYSFANPFPDNAALAAGYKLTNDIDAGFVILADLNPGVSGESNVLGVTIRSTARQIRLANSRNHGREGQNVLFADGHVEFDNTPFVGMDRDNIYCRSKGGPGTTAKDSLIISPEGPKDTVLLPVDTK